MQTQTIRHQYNEIIAPHYDLDPQSVIGRSLDRAAGQIRSQPPLGHAPRPLAVLDVGVGTGLFLAKLRAAGALLQPFGLDLSERMIAAPRRRIPDLQAAVDDAANLDGHFPGQPFDLISTHFVTGFVPMRVLAPKVWARLQEGGYWSLAGGTRAGYPALRARANNKVFRWLSGAGEVVLDELACNPAGRDEVVRTLEDNGFAVRACETFEPKLSFKNMDEFMEFALRGGWLTPFIEALGLHEVKGTRKLMMNLFLFPITDHHSIEIVLAQKVSR